MDWEGGREGRIEGEIKGRGREGGNGIWRKEREGIMERRDRGREVEGKESEGRGMERQVRGEWREGVNREEWGIREE